MVLADLPEAAGVGDGRHAFVDHHGGAIRQRAIGHVAVASDPADVGGTPEQVVFLQIEHPLRGLHRAEQIAAGAVLDAFRLAGGAGGVEQEQRVFGIDEHRIAGRWHVGRQFVPPQIAAGGHRDAVRRALGDDHLLDQRAAQGQRFVDGLLQLDEIAAALVAVGGDHHAGTGVLDAVAQCRGREAAKHHRVGQAQTGAGLHRDHRFDRMRQVQHHAVALDQAETLQRIGELADLGVQFAIRVIAGVTFFAFVADGDLVATARQVTVQTVDRRVERAVVEPAVVRRVRFVEHGLERRFPAQLLGRELAPETLEISSRRSAQLAQLLGIDAGLGDERRRRREHAALGQARTGNCHRSLMVILVVMAPSRGRLVLGECASLGTAAWVGAALKQTSRPVLQARAACRFRCRPRVSQWLDAPVAP